MTQLDANPSLSDVDLLDELSTNPELMFLALQPPIAFNPVLVDIAQSLTAGLFLSSAIDDCQGEWVELDHEKIHRNTRLTQGELKGARQKLRDLGLMRERRVGFPARTEYSINFDKLKSMLITLSRKPAQTKAHASNDAVNASQAIH